jgi:hypothetical protein
MLPNQGFANQVPALAVKAQHLPFADNTFDAVFSIGSFEMIGDERPWALSEMIRVARRGTASMNPCEDRFRCRLIGLILNKSGFSSGFSEPLTGIVSYSAVMGYPSRKAIILKKAISGGWITCGITMEKRNGSCRTEAAGCRWGLSSVKRHKNHAGRTHRLRGGPQRVRIAFPFGTLFWQKKKKTVLFWLNRVTTILPKKDGFLNLYFPGY